MCLATSAAVDAAGAHYSQQSPPPGANGDAHPGAQPRKMSLMREMPWPKDTPESVRKAATFFYSASQLFATGALMLGCEDASLRPPAPEAAVAAHLHAVAAATPTLERHASSSTASARARPALTAVTAAAALRH